MFQLDDKFLQDVGLGDLPAEQKHAFLQHIYGELETRVGFRLSDGLSDEQLEEFESIIEKKPGAVDAWLGKAAPDYLNDPAFQNLMITTKLPADDPRLRDEYAATKWLAINRPDYRQVVAEVMDELKKEIVNNRDTILG